jgi:hypothetical protein
VFENRVLWRISGPKRDEILGDWRTLHNEELHNLYSSPSIVRMIKLRRMRWAGHAAGIVAKRNTYMMRWHGLDRCGRGQGPVEGSYEHCNEPSGSVKY